MNDQMQMEHERYAADLKALAECIARGVSEESIQQLAYEAGVDRRDLKALYERKAA